MSRAVVRAVGHDENDRVALEGLESAPSYDEELLA